jgi:ribulose-phosphate 3-epimerase
MKISASLHAADPLRLAKAVAAIGRYVASLHVDVMDGRFAPAFGFGERLVRDLIAAGGLPVDVHLMVEHPEPWAVRFAALGARRVAFHLETVEDPIGVARSIRAKESLAYVALLPETPLSRVPGGRELSTGSFCSPRRRAAVS